MKPIFDWEDPFLLQQELNDDERAIQASARQYARDKLLPRIVQANRNETFDRDIYREMGALPGQGGS